jgi:hypothetical protein
MQTLIEILQDNAMVTAICGIITALLIQGIKQLPWFEDITISDVIKGRIASLLVAIVTAIGGLLATGDLSNIWTVIIAALQTWFVAQGFWAGVLRGEKT